MLVDEIWKDLLIGDDSEVIRKGGFGKPRGLGKRPALLIIDPQPIYMGEKKPILEQLHKYPTAAGDRSWAALKKSTPVLEFFREKNLPVIFSRNVAKYLDFDNFSTKSEHKRDNHVEGNPNTELVKEVNLQSGDYVIDKGFASAFQGTPLVSYLNRLDVDTLVICGGTTSGCVRATVVDAASLNYNIGLLYECVFDRIELSHRSSLLDMWMKYADLYSVENMMEYLKVRC